MSEVDEKHQIIAHAYFSMYKENANRCAQIQAEYGKWLVTTLAALNFGGIYLVANIEGVAISVKLWPAFLLSVGICTALASGWYAWLNWSYAAQLFSDWAKPQMLVSSAHWPTEDKELSNSIERTRRASLFFGFLSVFFMMAAVVVFCRALM